ncbi:hypothetical protein MsAg5_03080 [Methanosarcinaceae archaeon Ag5]|uniref:Uncharacterized protein n=1 Tax=Methanolapillus africanus TaxID=3028297 RepID=A0AAE4SD76_9EURY|nr:hypothetical protein [Methanosarcinaceae archaeon Ag5]
MKNPDFLFYLNQKYENNDGEIQKRIAVIDDFEAFLNEKRIPSIEDAADREMEEYCRFLNLDSKEAAYDSYLVLGEYGEVCRNEDLMLLMVYFISAVGDVDAYLGRLKEVNLGVWEKISWSRFFGDER